MTDYPRTGETPSMCRLRQRAERAEAKAERYRAALLGVMRVGGRDGFSFAPTLATHGVALDELSDDGKEGQDDETERAGRLS